MIFVLIKFTILVRNNNSLINVFGIRVIVIPWHYLVYDIIVYIMLVESDTFSYILMSADLLGYLCKCFIKNFTNII